MRNDSASLGWVLRTVSFNKRPSDVDPVFLQTDFHCSQERNLQREHRLFPALKASRSQQPERNKLEEIVCSDCFLPLLPFPNFHPLYIRKKYDKTVRKRSGIT